MQLFFRKTGAPAPESEDCFPNPPKSFPKENFSAKKENRTPAECGYKAKLYSI